MLVTATRTIAIFDHTQALREAHPFAGMTPEEYDELMDAA